MTKPLNQPNLENIRAADGAASMLTHEADLLYPRVLYRWEMLKDLAKNQPDVADDALPQLELLRQAEESYGELMNDVGSLKKLQDNLWEVRKESLSPEVADTVTKSIGAIASFLDDILPSIEEAYERQKKVSQHSLKVSQYALSSIQEGIQGEIEGAPYSLEGAVGKLRQMRELLQETSKLIQKRQSPAKEDPLLSEVKGQLKTCEDLLSVY